MRGKGRGIGIMKEAVKNILNQNAEWLTLTSTPSAEDFYRKLGMEEHTDPHGYHRTEFAANREWMKEFVRAAEE